MAKKAHKNRKKIWLIILGVLAVLAAAALIFMRFGGFGTGESADPAALAACAGSVDDIAVPENVTMVALGEATHGNVEFQQLKLEVFRHLVETGGVRALALEGDYGGCEQVNRYIHGGAGTAQEAAAAIGFAIYRTKEMAELIAYMRDYNDNAAPGDDLRFYGFDMQRCVYCIRFLAEDCRTLGVDAGELEQLTDGENWTAAYDTAARIEIITGVKTALQGKENAEKAIHYADILLQNCELQTADPAAYGDIRDGMMAKNTLWIAEQEQKAGFSRIFVTGHDGHIGRFGYDNMGKLLADALGSGYYAIGTDFYKTACNMPKGSDGKRTTQVFYSHDPLAKAAKRAGLDRCWLDFAKASQDAALSPYVNDYHYMGSLGEGYSPLMRLLPPSYRIFQTPSQLYDGMIFISAATPTEIVNAE